MARIIRTNSANHLVPNEFPVLVNNGLQIIEPAFAYLLEMATLRARPAAQTTLRTYAEQLVDWFDTLEQNEIDWRLATTETLGRYVRRHHSGPSPITGRHYQLTTINARIRTVCRFYRWAAANAWIERTPFPTETLPFFGGTQGFLAHTQRRQPRERNPLVGTERPALRRGLYAHEVQGLLQVLTEPYHLMTAWGLCTGMRRMELCALTLNQIPDSMSLRERDNPLVKIPLTKTKGQRPRNAYAPLALIDRTNRYRLGARRAAAKAGEQHRNPRLFLGPRGAPVAPGEASRQFRKAAVRAGIDASLHSLRHTYASMAHEVLVKRQHTGHPINILMTLRDLLGHASVATTETYLGSLEIRAEKIEKALTYLYGEVIGDDPSFDPTQTH